MQNEQIKDFFCDNWEEIIEKIKEGLIIIDLKRTILYVNSAFEELLQFSKKELLGKPCKILECENCLTHNSPPDGQNCTLFTNGDVIDLRCTFKQKNGQRVTVLKNATLLTDKNGKVVGGVVTLTDLATVIDKEKVILKLRKELNRKNGFHGLIGNSSPMQQVYGIIKSAAQSDNPIIIYGESAQVRNWSQMQSIH